MLGHGSVALSPCVRKEIILNIVPTIFPSNALCAMKTLLLGVAYCWVESVQELLSQFRLWLQEYHNTQQSITQPLAPNRIDDYIFHFQKPNCILSNTIRFFHLFLFNLCYYRLPAAFTTGTSSSSGRICGSGPRGVMDNGLICVWLRV
jgi:hypothetical protein